MNRTERLYKIEQLLNERTVVPVDVLLVELGVALVTFKRDLEYLRERLHAPIEWDRELWEVSVLVRRTSTKCTYRRYHNCAE